MLLEANDVFNREAVWGFKHSYDVFVSTKCAIRIPRAGDSLCPHLNFTRGIQVAGPRRYLCGDPGIPDSHSPETHSVDTDDLYRIRDVMIGLRGSVLIHGSWTVITHSIRR